MSNGLQLPACQKCKLRKVRCDRIAPKCTNCAKGGVACIIVDPESGESFSRDYIARLEEEEKSLRSQLNRTHVAPHTPNAVPTLQSEDAQRSIYYVGDGSGLGFLHSILSNERWEQHRDSIISQLAARPRMTHRQDATPSSLPPPSEAEQLLENYFTRFHIHHTFLLRAEVLAIYNRIYSSLPAENANAPSPSPQDRFRLFMLFGISSTTRHRAGLSSEHPYGYFMAAEALLGSVPLIGSVNAIENLLLIARFGMYHNLGTSMWEVAQLCMRQCIEWGLHLQRSKNDLLTEQHHRRIFWACFIFDSHSSGILGRPFAISESDITVPLPVDTDDEVLATSAAPALDLVPPNTSSRPTELSMFIHCIRLRQISTRIHTTFYTGRGLEPRFKSIGHVYTCFSRFRNELTMWRSTTPIFPNPISLYEKPEWHDFLYEKDLMLLARGAMHNLAVRYGKSSVMKSLFIPTLDSASRVIELYADLMDKRAITWTRSYFQFIFTAGLTVIYCVSLDVEMKFENDRDPARILATASKILNFFKDKMPDAGSFAIVFDFLREECIRHRDNTGSINNSSAMPSNTDSIAFGSSMALANTTIPYEHTYSGAPIFNTESVDLNFGLTDNLDLMTQLETGLGEYAWGWLPDGNYINLETLH